MSGRQRLNALIGSWTFETAIDGVVAATGPARMSWLEEESFLLFRTWNHVAEGDPLKWQGRVPDTTTTVIGYDDSAERFGYLYTDSRGVSRSYLMRLDGNSWEVWGETTDFRQRFEATISADGDTIDGAWFMARGNGDFAKDFDQTYVRQRR